MLKKILLILIILLIAALGMYYWFFYRANLPTPAGDTTASTTIPRFVPLNRGGNTPTPDKPGITPVVVVPDNNTISERLPALRHLSIAPVSGYMSSTTPLGTLVRYIDRGVGHIFETLSTTNTIDKISNTTIPRIYEGYWNKKLTAVVLRYLKDDMETPVNFYGEIRPLKTATSSDTNVPATVNSEIKGKYLSSTIEEIAVSPKGDRIFTFNIENEKGAGYISGFDETKKLKVLDTPITQVSVEWPEENTVAITTKASNVSSGYLYFLDVKKSSLKKILGKITGLTTKTSSDAKKVLLSSAGQNNIITSLYNVKDNSVQEIVFKTLADKCVWSKLHPNDVYCAVPTELPQGSYPDDWYKGNVSFVDQIWHLDTTTGEVHLMANLLSLSNELIDATDLSLDPKENFLYFINKRDLTLWSLDLNL